MALLGAMAILPGHKADKSLPASTSRSRAFNNFKLLKNLKPFIQTEDSLPCSLHPANG
jgi:hypothetical protein